MSRSALNYLDQLGCQESDWGDLETLCQFWLDQSEPIIKNSETNRFSETRSSVSETKKFLEIRDPVSKGHFQTPIELDGLIQCQARIRSGQRCSRKCKNSEVEFCGNHLKTRPCGRYDDPVVESQLTTGKCSKGRRSQSTNLSTAELNKIDLDHYIKTRPVVINDKNFLIDENHVIYSDTNDNLILGIQRGTEYEWFLGSFEN